MVPYLALMYLCARISRLMSGASAIQISGTNISDFEWTPYSTQLSNTMKASNSNNTFAIMFDASESACSQKTTTAGPMIFEEIWQALSRTLGRPFCDSLVATILKDTQSTRDGSGRIQLALSDIRRAALGIEAIPIQMDLACSNFWSGAKIWKSSLCLQSMPASLRPPRAKREPHSLRVK